MQFCIVLFIHNFMRFHHIFFDFLYFFEDLKLKITIDYGAEFMVPFFSGSRSIALKSSLKSHQMTTCFVQNDQIFTQMMMISLCSFIEQKKLSFDDFLMTT